MGLIYNPHGEWRRGGQGAPTPEGEPNEPVSQPEGESPKKDEALDIKAQILSFFDKRDNIQEAIFRGMLDRNLTIKDGGTAEEIKTAVDDTVTALENEGLIKFNPETKEFSKVTQENAQ